MLTAQVRESYCRHRTLFTLHKSGNQEPFCSTVRYDGGTIRGITYQSVWVPLAKFLSSNRLDADACIAYRFSNADVRGQPPEPMEIADDTYLPEYRKVMRQAIDDAATELRTQKSILVNDIELRKDEGHDDTATLKFILLDQQLQLSPLFRYCIAEKFGLESIAARYHDSAARQFGRASNAYTRAWAEWLPIALRNNGQHVVDSPGQKAINPRSP